MRALKPRPGLRELGPLLALAFFVVAVAVELLAPVLRADGAPTSAYADAIRAHADELTPGTRVLIQPPWRDDVLDALPKLPAGVRASLALSTNHGAEPGRVLVIADPAEPLPRARTRVARPLAYGPVDVYLITTPRPKGTLVLDDLIASADVAVVSKEGERTECRWDAEQNKHACPGLSDWMWVGPMTVSSGSESRRCLWSHPTGGGQVITRFPARVLPDGDVVLRHALKDRVATSGAPVQATVKLDGRVLGKLTRDTKRGFRVHRLKLPSTSAARSLEVVVETENSGARHYCFSLSIEPRGAK